MLALIKVAFVFGLATFPTLLHAQINATSNGLADTYRQVVGSVVHIEVGTLLSKTGSGSGVILHKDGYIATAAHVVAESVVIAVTFSDDSFREASIVTLCREQDLALLKVEQIPESAHPAKLVMASKVTPGLPVFCIGAPYDLRFSITSGIVSAVRDNLGPVDLTWRLPSRMIQTDTAINPGNSGGPIFNYDGEVIGIAVSVLNKADGIGWAVPADLIRHYLIDQAVPFGGLFYLRVTPTFTSLMNWKPEEALIVESVQDGSLAAEAGLRGGRLRTEIGGLSVLLGGDVIYLIGGHSVSEYAKVQSYLRGLTQKDEIRMTILREGKMMELHVPFKILELIPSIQVPGAEMSSTSEPVKQNKKTRWSSPDAP